MSTRSRALVALVVALTAAGTTASRASADSWSGQPGPAYRSMVWCINGNAQWRIAVDAPRIYAVPLPGVNPDGTVIIYGSPTHYQRVSYRANLYRWNGARWVYQRSADRMATLVTDTASYEPPSWTNMRTGRLSTSGDTSIPIATRGYYRVTYDVLWYDTESTWAGGWRRLDSPLGYVWRSDDMRPRGRTWCMY
jgi:hypothetical protein